MSSCVPWLATGRIAEASAGDDCRSALSSWAIFFCFIPFIRGGSGQWFARRRLGRAQHRRLFAARAHCAEAKRGAPRGCTAACKARRRFFFLALWLLYASFGGYNFVFAATAIFSLAGAVTGFLMTPPVPRRRAPAAGADSNGGVRFFVYRTGDICRHPAALAQRIAAGDYQFHHSLRAS